MNVKSILSIAYGIDVKPVDDPYVEIAEKALNVLTISSFSALTYLMEAYPWLKHYPSWAPGGGFQIRAREMRKPVDALSGFTLDFVKRGMKDGTLARSSVASRNLQELEELGRLNEETELALSDVTASMYAGEY